jgi:hypothetical protein
MYASNPATAIRKIGPSTAPAIQTLLFELLGEDVAEEVAPVEVAVPVLFDMELPVVSAVGVRVMTTAAGGVR